MTMRICDDFIGKDGWFEKADRPAYRGPRDDARDWRLFLTQPPKPLRLPRYGQRPDALSDLLARRLDAILELQADWDDEGAQPVAEDTFTRASDFLRQQEQAFAASYGQPMPLPAISPTPDGGIDLLWRSDAFDLLVNIQPQEAIAAFYGDDRAHQRISGTIDLTRPSEGLLAWLAKK